jgi:hypothetical protein
MRNQFEATEYDRFAAWTDSLVRREYRNYGRKGLSLQIMSFPEYAVPVNRLQRPGAHGAPSNRHLLSELP